MATIRQAYRKQYTSISNSLAQNNSLSLRARGLMIYFLSLPDDWKIHVNHLTKTMKEGRDAILSALKELKLQGYIHHVKLGLNDGWQYFTFEKPVTSEEFKLFLRTNGFSGSSNKRVSLLTENPQLQKNNSKHINKTYNSPDCANADQSSSKIFFSFDEYKFLNISQEDILRWKKVYPSIDINNAIIKMEEWCRINSSKAKKKKKWDKFISNWLVKNEEKYKRQYEVNDSKIKEFIGSVQNVLNENKKIIVYSFFVETHSKGKPFAKFYYNSPSFYDDIIKYFNLEVIDDKL